MVCKYHYYYNQTTQWFAPIAVDGTVEITTSKGTKKVGIKQIHMEEDAGKLVHDILPDTTHVDFNRTSVPLIEIVSRPDLSSAEEVIAYLERLHSLLRFARVSDCRWEQGSMRCDVNLSVRPEGSDVLGVRTEIKNMNSLAAIERAIEYETARHIDALENGTEVLVQETRRWDDVKGKSYAMRTKETAGDYRYFPDPNVMPVVIDDTWYAAIEESLPELPEIKRARYVDVLGLSEYDADKLIESRALCDCFEDAIAAGTKPKDAANWLISEVMNNLNARKMTYDQLTLSGTTLAKLAALVADGKVSRPNARKILTAVFDDPSVDPATYAEENGMVVSGDADALLEVVRRVVLADPKSVADYKGGREKVLMAFFGRCMKELRGNCDPQTLQKALVDFINSI